MLVYYSYIHTLHTLNRCIILYYHYYYSYTNAYQLIIIRARARIYWVHVEANWVISQHTSTESNTSFLESTNHKMKYMMLYNNDIKIEEKERMLKETATCKRIPVLENYANLFNPC